MLPYVVYAADPSNVNIEFDFTWKRTFVPCTKQEDSSSCRAYMLTTVDCLLRNKSLKFRARNELLRKRIAMDLLDCRVKPPQKPKAEELLKVVTKEVQLEDHRLKELVDGVDFLNQAEAKKSTSTTSDNPEDKTDHREGLNEHTEDKAVVALDEEAKSQPGDKSGPTEDKSGRPEDKEDQAYDKAN
ncbi:hypothetical protein FRX31_030547 [Thalictrum thalictroides]|uniref:Uncharacterized protein n=1 Tax=Thalictrum thalictroides TaxID=46969 RepID=A0A7J6V6Q3_THATH|nr:hypothetical protein FRX31_030547 [Thalictrum thalictroides]